MQHAGGARGRALRGRVSSPAPVNHCKRSYLWSAPRGELAGIAYNRELLHLASMIQDVPLVPRSTAISRRLKDAGGDATRVPAAGTGVAAVTPRRKARRS